MTKEEKTDLKKLLFYMESDPKMGHVGMAEKFEQFEKRLESMENKHKVIYRVSVVIGAIGGGALTWMIKLKSLL
jgi:hypothetical protein